jgi:hypothetical protein
VSDSEFKDNITSHPIRRSKWKRNDRYAIKDDTMTILDREFAAVKSFIEAGTDSDHITLKQARSKLNESTLSRMGYSSD